MSLTTISGVTTTGAPHRTTDGRRARTRAALVEAAQRLLSEGRVAVPIQEITDAADVGLGSFYNHFTTKDELFDAAVVSALTAHHAVIAEVTRGIDDPAELFAIGVRTTGRLQRSEPALVRVLLHQGTGVLLRDEGIAPRARADIRAGIATGRFPIADPELALVIAGGSLLGLLQVLDANPGTDAGEATDRLAESLLRMFGVPGDEAADIASRPLRGDATGHAVSGTDPVAADGPGIDRSTVLGTVATPPGSVVTADLGPLGTVSATSSRKDLP